MVKKEAKPGEGGQQEQKGNQLARRDNSPLTPTEESSGQPRALFEIEKVEEKRVDWGLSVKVTRFRLRNLFPGKPKK